MSTPHEVIMAALAADLPEGTLHDRALLIEAALVEHGHLPEPHREATLADVEEVCRWLADQSRHPRYVLVHEGWRKILASDADLTLAGMRALGNAANEADRDSVHHAVAVVRRWIDTHPPETPGGTPTHG